ncbi:transglutaminase-like domain-containing protein [Dermacoccaceae bacterium W4C1]
MKRTVTARLDVSVEAPSTVALAITVAQLPGLEVQEDFDIAGAKVLAEIAEPVGGVRTILELPAGQYSLNYSATVTGEAQPVAGQLADTFPASLPSRYCESDKLMGTATDLFGDVAGMDLLNAVRSWVNGRLDYVLGASRVTDGAVDTYLARDGVCRDYAHLTVAMLRARGIPARLVAAYAPGLDPMDFHAVAEAWIENGWYVVDSTGLAPRQSLLRICTGRDAADTSFMTTLSGNVALTGIEVSAVVADPLPADDQVSPVQLV